MLGNRIETLVKTIAPWLPAEDARAIAAIGFLAAEADLEEPPEEVTLLAVLCIELCSHAGIPLESLPMISPLPTDDEERITAICSIATLLTERTSKELAYVVGYCLVVADLELAPVEATFLEQLQHVLEIPDDRAADLAARAGEMLTPFDEEEAFAHA